LRLRRAAPVAVECSYFFRFPALAIPSFTLVSKVARQRLPGGTTLDFNQLGQHHFCLRQFAGLGVSEAQAVERYIAAFPGSRYQDQTTQLAIYTLGQLHDPARLAGFTVKALAASPNCIASIPGWRIPRSATRC